jgi:uncharacterized membrane protein YkvA (DUF1232 family)
MGSRNPLKFGLGALSFWPFLPVAPRAPLYGRLLWELAKDERVPWSRKALLGFAALYVASPIDVIPDFIPVISRIDDMAVVVISIDLFLESIPHELMVQKMYELGIDGRELERDLESMRRVVPGPIRHAARRLPEAIDQGAKLIRMRLAGQRTPRSKPQEALPE